MPYTTLPVHAADTELINSAYDDFGIECLSTYGPFKAILFHGDRPFSNGEMMIQNNVAHLTAFAGDAIVAQLKEGDTVTVGGVQATVREEPRSDAAGIVVIYITV